MIDNSGHMQVQRVHLCACTKDPGTRISANWWVLVNNNYNIFKWIFRFSVNPVDAVRCSPVRYFVQAMIMSAHKNSVAVDMCNCAGLHILCNVHACTYQNCAYMCNCAGWVPRFVLRHCLERFNLCIQFIKVQPSSSYDQNVQCIISNLPAF